MQDQVKTIMHPSSSLINGDQDGDVTSKKPTFRNAVIIFLSEFIGTALLVFITCTGCTIEDKTSLLQRSLTSGLSVATVIQIFGHLSGAHVNPAITLCALIMGEIPVTLTPVYVCAQVLGCLSGYGIVVGVTPDVYLLNVPMGQCVTSPHEDISLIQGILVETMATFIMALAVCATWDHANGTRGDGVPLKIGFVVAVLNLAAGSYTGASMNPARSLGPVVWNQKWKQHWIYWVGPVLGASLSGILYKTVFLNKQ